MSEQKTESTSSGSYVQNAVQIVVSSIREIPPVSKALIAAFIFFYFATFIPQARELVVLKPGNTVLQKFYMWNVFTSTYIETHFLSLFFSIGGVIVSSVWLLQSPQQAQQNSFTIIPWTKTMYFKFIVIVNAFIGLLSCIVALLAFVAIQNTDILYAEYNGFHGCLSGFTVVLKQQLPEQQFSILNIGTIRGKHIPLLTVVIGAIHGVIVGQVTDFLYLIIGVYVAWFYLRFFQLHDDGAKGDMAESFSFSSFFPNAIQPYISSISNVFYVVLVKVGIVKKVRIMSPLTPMEQAKANSNAPPTRKIEIVVDPQRPKETPSTEQQSESQRRKELAKRAIEKRMASKQETITTTEEPKV